MCVNKKYSVADINHTFGQFMIDLIEAETAFQARFNLIFCYTVVTERVAISITTNGLCGANVKISRIQR